VRRLKFKGNILYWLVSIMVLTTIFGIYSIFMQRYVGACDFYGYYNEALLLKSGKVHMETGLNPSKYPCTAPLGYHVRDGKVVPQYPPGYPLLLAVGSFLGAEFYVNPLIGVLSVVVMFLLLLKLTDKRTAVLFSLLWAFSPIVVWGSTYVMSDLVATFFIMLGFYLFIQEKPGASAICLAFSLAVRPTNLLFLIVLVPLLIKKQQWLRFGLHFFIPTLIYCIFNWIIYGAPYCCGYGKISNKFLLSVFFPHLVFYLKEIMVQLTPFLVILAFVALGKRAKASWFYVKWFLIFLIFYCFWAAGGDAWWWTRFLLPSFPALFILAALGLKIILDKVDQKWKRIHHKYSTPLLSLITIIMVIYFVHYGKNHDVYRIDKGYAYYYISEAVGKVVPPNSIVGSFELSGAVRLYTGLETFNWYNWDAVPLIRRMLKKNIPVYVVVERCNLEHFFVKRILKKFHYDIIKNINIRENWFVRKDNWLFKITKTKKRIKRGIKKVPGK